MAAAFTDGTGITLRFAWKTNTAQFWSQQTLPGVTDAQFLAQDPAITWTGGNLLVTAVQDVTSGKQRLDFWWQGTTFTTFNRETVTAANYPAAFGPPALTYDPAAPGRAVVTPHSLPTPSPPPPWTTGPSPPAAPPGPSTKSTHPNPPHPERGAGHQARAAPCFTVRPADALPAVFPCRVVLKHDKQPAKVARTQDDHAATRP